MFPADEFHGCSIDNEFGEVILNNERDTREVARRMGLKDVVFLNYRNHLMDGAQMLEIRARLIFVFRLHKIDTVLVYDSSLSFSKRMVLAGMDYKGSSHGKENGRRSH